MTPRLIELINRNVMPVTESGCWIWLGGINAQGYGQILGVQKTRRAHRIIYELYKGPIPENMMLDHLCRVRCCVNPDHLEPVTNKENILRGIGITAENARKPNCPNGHQYIELTRKDNRTYRRCRICQAEAMRRLRRQRSTHHDRSIS